MFPAVKRRALLGSACHSDVRAVTGANMHFMIQSTPLKLLFPCSQEEHTKPGLQVMLIHLISATSHSTDLWEQDSSFLIKVMVLLRCNNFFALKEIAHRCSLIAEQSEVPMELKLFNRSNA